MPFAGIFDRSGSGKLNSLSSILAVLSDYDHYGQHAWVGDKVAVCSFQWCDKLNDQKLPWADNRFVLTGDFRIDNRLDLVHTLGLDPQASDADCLIGGYLKWGVGLADKLVGAFAFALWDRLKQEFYCARDHVGLRPFYFFRTATQFVFSADINGLLAAPGQTGKADEGFLLARLEHKGFNHPSRTAYLGIHKLQPGHWLRVGPDFCEEHKYWFPELLPEQAPNSALQFEEFAVRYHHALNVRLSRQGKTGVHVSGGYDSTLVAMSAAKMLQNSRSERPVAYTWMPSGAPDELEMVTIRGIAESIDGELKLANLTPENYCCFLNRDIRRDPSTRVLVNDVHLLRDAKALGVDVILSGFGGDEGVSFDGRGLASTLLRRGRIRTLFTLARQAEGPTLNFLIKRAIIPLLGRWLKPLTSEPFRETLADLTKWRTLKRSNRNPFTLPDFRHRVSKVSMSPVFHDDVLETRLAILSLGNSVARLEDFFLEGAKAGIEYRYPLLDRRLLEFALTLPPEFFHHQGQRRWFFLNAGRSYLPDSVFFGRLPGEPLRSRLVREIAARAFQLTGQRLSQTRISSPAYIDLQALQRALSQGNGAPGLLMHTCMFLKAEPGLPDW